MDYLRAIVLGVIEGLTEFLPISSTGHMVIAMPVLGIRASESPWRVLLWVSQFAAILAVITLFWRDLLRRLLDLSPARWDRHLAIQLVAAMLPTIVLAVLFKDYLDPLEESPIAVAVALLVGAGAIAWIDARRHESPMELTDITLKQAVIIGAIQAISMVPGVSRSGATIMGGMLLGLSPRVATEFSFYLAIPTMLAAAVKTLWDERDSAGPHAWDIIAIGSVVSYVVALAVVAWFLDFVKRRRFTIFVWYRVALAAAVLAAYAIGWRGQAAP